MRVSLHDGPVLESPGVTLVAVAHDELALARRANGGTPFPAGAESGAAPPSSPLAAQPVYRIRYGEPIEILYDRQTLVNGRLIPEESLETLEQLYGPPPWTQLYFSQVVVNVFEKRIAKDLGIQGLADLLILLTQLSGNRANRLIAEEGRNFMGRGGGVRRRGSLYVLCFHIKFLVILTNSIG